MKTTEIYIRAFNDYFSLEVSRKDYLTLSQCIKYVRYKLGWDTAMVKQIKQGAMLIANDNYTDPEEICFMEKNLQTT